MKGDSEMKKCKYVFKWFLYVIISFSIIFTTIKVIEIAEGNIAMKQYKGEMLYSIVKFMDDTFSKSNIESEYDDDNTKTDKAVFREYPAGAVYYKNKVSELENGKEQIGKSLILGMIIGTAVFLVLNKKQNSIKSIFVIYLALLIPMGLIEGISSITPNTNILDIWVFPERYIIIYSLIFLIIFATYIIRQKKIATQMNNKLNIK